MEPSATPSQQFTSHEEAYKAGYNAAIEEYISNPGGLKKDLSVDLPKLVCVKDYEEYCRRHMEQSAWFYFSGGAGTETTAKDNTQAFMRIRIRPRYLVDVSNIQTRMTVQGSDVSIPLGISPTAFHKWATPEGEIATARAAERAGVVYISSIHSNTRMGDIASAAPNAIKWQQMYIYTNRTLTVDLLRRAENAGFRAVVLTIDKPYNYRIVWPSIRGLSEFPSDLKESNFPRDNSIKTDPTLTWEDVSWFCNQTTLPVILKGILTEDDARKAIKVGARGILVSNHGGRSVDGLPATLDALPEVVAAVDDSLDVYLDGGVRTGTDIFKALSRGAKMVFVGRPAIWGLGQGGEAGLLSVLDILKKELVSTMQMSGYPTLKDLGPNCVLPANS